MTLALDDLDSFVSVDACDHALVLLADVPDGAARRVPLRLRDHLDRCASCRATAAELWLGAAAIHVLARDAGRPVEPVWGRRRAHRGLALVATCALAAAAVLVLVLAPPDEPPGPAVESASRIGPAPDRMPPPAGTAAAVVDSDADRLPPWLRQILGPRGGPGAPRVIITRGPGPTPASLERPIDLTILVDASPSWLGVPGVHAQDVAGCHDRAVRALEYLRKALPRSLTVEVALFRDDHQDVIYPRGPASRFRASLVPFPADGDHDAPTRRSATARAVRWAIARPVEPGHARVVLLLGSGADLTYADPAVDAARRELRTARVPLFAIHAHHDAIRITDELTSLDAIKTMATVCSLSEYEVAYPDMIDCARALLPMITGTHDLK